MLVLVVKFSKHRKKTRATSYGTSSPEKVHVCICTVVDVLSVRIAILGCVHDIVWIAYYRLTFCLTSVFFYHSRYVCTM